MNPRRQFCHNPACSVRGQVGQGNNMVHSRQERHYRCTNYGQPFAATAGMPFYRLDTAVEVVTTVLTLLSYGCPLQAIVAAFAVDERTVTRWLARAGQRGSGRAVPGGLRRRILHGRIDAQLAAVILAG